MDNKQEKDFYNPSKGSMKFEEVIKEINDYILEKPGFFYDIVVGCDSPSSDKPFFPISSNIICLISSFMPVSGKLAIFFSLSE